MTISRQRGPQDVVNLYVWSGDGIFAANLAASRYPGIEITKISHRRMRDSGFIERVRLLHGLRGRAIIFYFASLADVKYRKMIECLHFLHRCRETVLCDGADRWETLRTRDILGSAPEVLSSILLDLKTLIFWWGYLRLRLMRAAPIPNCRDGSEIAYLIPSLANPGSSGGAISHIRGFLYGLKAAGRTCRVFSGTVLAQDAFETAVIAPQRRSYFLWEAATLAYNLAFVQGVQKSLASTPPLVFYQRHCRFSIAGALLSTRLQVPLVLEYNGSEVWMADHWDPSPLRSWIGLCEEVTLHSAARILVVSDVLRDDLLARGIPADRIRVNPNAVDSDYFCPGRGRESGRKQLHVGSSEVLVGFVGSFSLWHGIEVLQQAIASLLSNGPPCRLRFALMGDGLLHGEMRGALAVYEKTGEVIFTGPLPHEKVAEYLDASDILVSPHIPMPDGSRFFGSPIKLFEYMAMGKGIVASRLDQLADVLEHERTALLVNPGDAEELAAAILRLALNPAEREALGAAARREAVDRHGWSRNVTCALGDLQRVMITP
jgi:glycosyltransferase involved in cell wall biosynthesis